MSKKSLIDPKSAIAAISGGVLLGTVTMTKFKYNGNTLGISGIVGGITQENLSQDQIIDRLVFLFGILFSGLLMRFVLARESVEKMPYTVLPFKIHKLLKVVLSGLLVGFGTGLAHGCTSGHGIFGNSRLSLRSLVATITFLLTAFVTFGLCKYLNLTSVSSYQLSESKKEEDAIKKKKKKSISAPKPPSSLSSGELIMVTFFMLVTYEFSLFFIYQMAIQSKEFELCRRIVDFLHGFYFGIGLKICGMASPTNVLAFFDISDNFIHWDPSLMMVMVGAIGVAKLLYTLNGTETPNFPPLLAEAYKIAPYASTFIIDANLVVGSAIFGVGWSMMGYCPGPALLSLSLRSTSAAELLTNVIYNVAMFAGWAIYYRAFK